MLMVYGILGLSNMTNKRNSSLWLQSHWSIFLSEKKNAIIRHLQRTHFLWWCWSSNMGRNQWTSRGSKLRLVRFSLRLCILFLFYFQFQTFWSLEMYKMWISSHWNLTEGISMKAMIAIILVLKIVLFPTKQNRSSSIHTIHLDVLHNPVWMVIPLWLEESIEVTTHRQLMMFVVLLE
jgi:hypothetical protein